MESSPQTCPPPSGTTSAPTSAPVAGSSCAGAITISPITTGTLSTNSRGRMYADQNNCTWTLCAPSGSRVRCVYLRHDRNDNCRRVTITAFATEAGYDLFNIYDGTSYSSPVWRCCSWYTAWPLTLLRNQRLMSASGPNLPATTQYSSSSQCLFVAFMADYDTNSTGVVFSYAILGGVAPTPAPASPPTLPPFSGAST
jgi:hypothetical protein